MSRQFELSFDDGRLIVRVDAATDAGSVRVVNEDSFLAVPPVFVVADGMGGHAHGDRASQAVVRLFASRFPTPVPTTTDAVLTAIDDANRMVAGLGGGIAGTTVVGIALTTTASGELYWLAFNIGDSRLYRLTGGEVVQLSVDHSVVQELIDGGEITIDEAAVHPERNVVTRAVGVDEEAVPDLWFLPVGDEDAFLLCSDGLTKEVADPRLGQLLAAPSGASAERLVAAALRAGGRDNVTAVVVTARRSAALVAHPPETSEETLPREVAS